MNRRSMVVLLLGLPFFGGTVGCGNLLGIDDAVCNPELPECQASVSASSVCQRYCGSVMNSCTGDLQVYQSLANCLSVCSHLPEGNSGDTQGDTVNCRLNQAIVAGNIAEKKESCVAAGPGGNGVCGDNCDALCTLMQGVCTADALAPKPASFASLSECVQDCRGVTDLGTFNSFSPEMTAGSTVQCRLYHACAAAEYPPLHCKHAAGEEVCID